jgi:hypothetical protein
MRNPLLGEAFGREQAGLDRFVRIIRQRRIVGIQKLSVST